jgi:hypothetical protein
MQPRSALAVALPSSQTDMSRSECPKHAEFWAPASGAKTKAAARNASIMAQPSLTALADEAGPVSEPVQIHQIYSSRAADMADMAARQP